MKLAFNLPGFKETLSKVKKNRCLMHDFIFEKPVPVVAKAIFSNPEIILCEQFQMYLLIQVIEYIIDKEPEKGFDIWKSAFGITCPTILFRGTGESTFLKRHSNVSIWNGKYDQVRQ